MSNNNPNDLKVGDTIYVEEAWEDDSGAYHDEYAEVVDVEDDGTLHLKFNRPDVTEFLSTASFSAEDYMPEATCMTQPNQSELRGVIQEALDECFKYGMSAIGHNPPLVEERRLVAYITANYTPNSTVESLNSQIAWLDGKVEEMREEVAERTTDPCES